MPLRDATLLLVHLEHERPCSALLEALTAGGDGTPGRVLDAIIVSRRAARTGSLTEIDGSELALAGIALCAPGLIGVEDAARLAARLGVGASAAIILVEHGPSAAPASTLSLLQDRIIDVRPVPASVANTVWESAQAVEVVHPRSVRRRCTVTRRALHSSAGR